MEAIGVLKKAGGRYEFRSEELDLMIKGDFAEWVLAAAAEVLGVFAQRETEGMISELETLCEFGEAEQVALDSARYDMRARFEMLPQCIVTKGDMDYRWVSPEGREKLAEEFNGHPVKRLHDMALTRNDSFLENENGVVTSGN